MLECMHVMNAQHFELLIISECQMKLWISEHMFKRLKIRVECMYECLNTCKFKLLNAYMNAQLFDFWTDLVLRQKGRCSSFWPCTETRGSLFFILTLYWDDRVVVLHFDLVLRREGRKFWINLWIMSLRLHIRVVECGDMTLIPSIDFFYLFFLENAFMDACNFWLNMKFFFIWFCSFLVRCI